MAFDPSQPYEVLDAPKASSFDPSKPFEVVTDGGADLSQLDAHHGDFRRFLGLPEAHPSSVPEGPVLPQPGEEAPSFADFLFQPKIEIPRLNHPADESFLGKVARATGNVGGELISGASVPAFYAAPQAALGAAAPELITQQIKRLQEAGKTPDYSPERLESGLSTVALIAGAVHGLSHIGATEKPTEPALAPPHKMDVPSTLRDVLLENEPQPTVEAVPPQQPAPTVEANPLEQPEMQQAEPPPFVENYLEQHPAQKERKLSEPRSDGGFSDDPLVRFVIDDMGGVLSKSAAEKKLGERFQANQYDDAPNFSDPRHRKVYNPKSGQLPDVIATAAADMGLLPEGADASTLWDYLQRTSDSAKSMGRQLRDQGLREKLEIKQGRQFEAAAAKQEPGEAAINATNLQVGDTVTVSGEPFKVTDIDPDNFDVTLEDGAKFGIQTVGDNQIIYGEHALGPNHESFGLEAPESPEEQAARLAQEEQDRTARDEAQAAQDQVDHGWQQKLAGDTGDLGQGDMFGGGDLFAEAPLVGKLKLKPQGEAGAISFGPIGRRAAKVPSAQEIANLSRNTRAVTAATSVPPPGPPPTVPPGVGRFGSGSRLVRDTFKRWLGHWDARRQLADAKVMKLGHDILRTVPDKARREAIYNWAAAGGDGPTLRAWAAKAPADVKKGYTDALTLNAGEKAVGQTIRAGFDDWFTRAQQLGMVNDAADNYLKRIVTKRPELADEALSGQFRAAKLSGYFAEAQRRFWEVMVDAEHEGIRYDKDVAKSSFLYARSFTHAAIDRAAVKKLFELETDNGRPLVTVEGMARPIEASEGRPNPTLMVNPFSKSRISGQADLAKELQARHPSWSDGKAQAVARDKILQEYTELPEAKVLRDWVWTHEMEDGTQVFVKGNALVHKSIAEAFRNKFATQRIDWLDKYVVRPQAFVKGSKLSLSLFHDVHERVNAAGHLSMLSGLRPLEDYLADPNIRAGLENGLQMVGSARDAALFAEGMAAHGWPEMVPGLGKYVKAYKDLLFEDQIPRMKARMYLDAYARNAKRYGRTLNEEQLAVLTAKQANATFGEQNYRQMIGKLTGDPRFWQFLQGSFLAPDFGISKLQHIGQAFTRYGGEQRMAIGLVAAGLYTSARLLNMMLNDGDPKWGLRDLFSITVGNRRYTLRSLPGDLMHGVLSPTSYVTHRLAPFVNNLHELLWKRDHRGNVVDWSDQLKDILLSPVPIPLAKPHGFDWRDQLASALGLSPSVYSVISEAYGIAHDWMKSRGIKVDDTAHHSDYADLRRALEDKDESAARKEYGKLLQTRSPAKVRESFERSMEHPLAQNASLQRKMLNSLSPADKATVQKAIEERKRILRDFYQLRAKIGSTGQSLPDAMKNRAFVK